MTELVEEIRNMIEQFEAGDTLPLVEEIMDVIEGSDWFDERMASAFQRGVKMGAIERENSYRNRTPQDGW